MSRRAETAVEIEGLTKFYGPVIAVKQVSFTIEAGQYFVLLGPSGGGKTTLLRLIGGFIKPNGGRILLHGHDVSNAPPNLRPTTMVFQSYALFPHMTVARNVGYGLRIKRLRSAQIRERVAAMLELVGLAGYGERMPHELSGGQQQRVQLARSLVLEADILLLDEPLASLDAKLRKEMCLELKHIQEKVGMTFVHVTHNQEEAMTVADRLAIIADGELVETGTARDVYERPVKRFTADFVGERNIFDGKIAAIDRSGVTLDLGVGAVEVPAGKGGAVGDPASMSIRSELVELIPVTDEKSAGMQILKGVYRESVYLGHTISHLVALPDGREVVVRDIAGSAGAATMEPGAPACVCWSTSDASLHLS